MAVVLGSTQEASLQPSAIEQIDLVEETYYAVARLGRDTRKPFDPACLRLFTTTIGSMLEQRNIRCAFRQIARLARHQHHCAGLPS
jgi:hypothetical protein